MVSVHVAIRCCECERLFQTHRCIQYSLCKEPATEAVTMSQVYNVYQPPHTSISSFWKQHLCELHWVTIAGRTSCFLLRQLHRTVWHVVPGHLDLHSAGWPGSLHGKEWSANLPLDLTRTRSTGLSLHRRWYLKGIARIMDTRMRTCNKSCNQCSLWVGSIDPGAYGSQKTSEDSRRSHPPLLMLGGSISSHIMPHVHLMVGEYRFAEDRWGNVTQNAKAGCVERWFVDPV